MIFVVDCRFLSTSMSKRFVELRFLHLVISNRWKSSQ